MGGVCSTYGGQHTNIQVSGGGNVGGKRPIGRRRLSWEDNIKMDLQEVGLIWLRIGTSGGHL